MASDQNYKDAFIARQPIFDQEQQTWGYLLLYRNCAIADCADFPDSIETTANVIACLPGLADCIPGSCKAMIRFPSQALQKNLPRTLRPECTAMVMAPATCDGQRDLKALSALKSEGYTVAVDDALDCPNSSDLLSLSDIMVVDFQSLSPEQIERLTDLAAVHGLQLMAKKVESIQAVEQAKRLGFSLFHGHFFKKPKLSSTRTVPSSQAARLKIFETLQTEEPDFEALTTTIKSDAAISFRLLTFLNSAHFSFPTTVGSIRQAVVLAGWKSVRNWLRLILLTDLQPTEKTRELSYLSGHRAKFLETVARQGDHAEIADKLFMLGLFSLLEPMFDMPMADILNQVALDKDISRALLGKDSPLSPWLALIRTIENGQWDAMGHVALGLGLPAGSVSESYREAYEWADDFFGPRYLSRR